MASGKSAEVFHISADLTIAVSPWQGSAGSHRKGKKPFSGRGFFNTGIYKNPAQLMETTLR